MKRRGAQFFFVAVSIAVMMGCDAGPADLPSTVQAEAIADQEDAVCGMLVRDQPAPRGQVVHRDGTRFFFCSLGDLLVHRSAPSPHGATTDVFIEVLGVEENPADRDSAQHPWAPAGSASYVVGVPRPGIMGLPVLAYANAEGANSVASRHDGARVLDFAELEAWWKEEQTGSHHHH